MKPDDPTGPPGDERDEPAGPGDAGEHEIPPPATWAGRERAGEPAGDGPSTEAEEPTEPGEPTETGGTQETTEADTLAIADREEAEEAALAGLRARAAEQAAKRETGAHAAAADPVASEPDAAASEAAASEPDAAPAPTPAAAGSAAPGAAGSDAAAGSAAPAVSEPAGEAPRPRALWARFLAASLVIVISTATATSVSLLLVLTDLASGLGGIPGVERELTAVGGGDPQTILILGSDERLGGGGDEGGARSDTAILLRVDPGRDAIGLLSIPRDLRVNVPGVGVEKFNAAYAHGGPRLALRVVKQLTDLDVNHVVNINFTGFADAVNAIDCVFIDVDRRYFVPQGSEYSAIDPPIEAGYQRLCGLKALQYVRFRHDDNDLVRAARQQDFLREARQKIPPSRLVSDRKELVSIFKEYTTSDQGLENPIQLLELLKTFLAARNANVNEIHFPAQLGDADSPYVTADQKEIKDTVDQFLGVEGTPGPKPGSAGPRQRAKRREERRAAKRKAEREKEDSGPAMIDAPVMRDYAQLLADTTTRRGVRRIDFPIFYPSEVPAATTFNPIDASRAFPIDGPDNEVYEGYKLVVGIPGASGFTEYYGVSGTSWNHPPILENPSETRKIDGREYLLFYDGDRLRLVGWKQRRSSYWVNNTLLQSLNEGEMLAIARSMRELGG